MPDQVRHDGGLVLAPRIAASISGSPTGVDFMNGIKDLRPAPGITGL